MKESINWKELIMDPFEVNKNFETVTASLAKNGEYKLVNKMIRFRKKIERFNKVKAFVARTQKKLEDECDILYFEAMSAYQFHKQKDS